jgi:molybdopterin molybdotransferase
MKRSTFEQSIDLEVAQDLILKSCSVLSSEKLGLADAVGRVAARSHRALEALPGYDGSLRDGYAIGQLDGKTENTAFEVFQVIDEVAAGDTRKLYIKNGEAIQIMTGGLIPVGCSAVVPQENCERGKSAVRVSTRFLNLANTYIHKKGCEIAKGQVILPEGVVLSVDQQITLAGVGYDFVEVVKKPRIRFFCTGSELVTEPGVAKQAGQRFSGNNYLLSGLIPRYGGVLLEQEMVADDLQQVVTLMDRMNNSGCDVLISTGGMGAGKFDLIEEAFARCGGETLYRSLNMRPGNATLFGKLGDTLFFGLPGPPPAVQLLFHELIRPAIYRLQGASECKPQEITAILAEDLSFPQRGLQRLKSGQVTFEDGVCRVRTVQKGGVSNCYIVCSLEKNLFASGEKVTIHLI